MKKRIDSTVDDYESPSASKSKRSMNKNNAFGFRGIRGAAISKSQGYYNPALIKKQKEFYRNASYVSKFRKKVKHQIPESNSTSIQGCRKEVEDGAEDKSMKQKKTAAYGLNREYKKHKNNTDTERMEKEVAIAARKKLKENAEGRRKSEREKMMKKTKRGQPLMKFRIEHLLQTIKDSPAAQKN